MKGKKLTGVQAMNLQAALTQLTGGLNSARRILSNTEPTDEDDEPTGSCPHCGKALDANPDEPKDDEPAKDGPKDEPEEDQAASPAADAFGWGKAVAKVNAAATKGAER